MPNFLIRDLPQRTYDLLKKAAEENERSLNKEIAVRLDASLLAQKKVVSKEFLRRMAEIRSHQKGGDVPIEDIVAMIRRDRDDPNR